MELCLFIDRLTIARMLFDNVSLQSVQERKLSVANITLIFRKFFRMLRRMFSKQLTSFEALVTFIAPTKRNQFDLIVHFTNFLFHLTVSPVLFRIPMILYVVK